jgi:hypothetical protein
MRHLMQVPVPLFLLGVVRTELVLADREGRPWRLSLSPGMDRFIGHYPRLPELAAAGPLLTYEAAQG